MTRPDYDLIKFVRLLFEVNSDSFGLFGPNEQKRIQRWMDAVLPPTPKMSDEDADIYEAEQALKDLRKAAAE
jgi:hypothetical protein